MTKENSIRLSKSSQTKFNRIDLNFPKTGRVGIHGLNEEEIHDFYQILLCFQKPASGSIRISGEDILSYSKEQAEAYRRDKIGLVLANSRMQISLTILENIAYPLWLKNDKEADTKAKKALEELGLSSLNQKKPFELSSEDLQKASLAQCIAKNAEVILANDPYSSLSKEEAEHIFSLLKEQSKQRLVLVCCKKEALTESFDSEIIFENRKIVSNPSVSTKQETYQNNKSLSRSNSHLSLRGLTRSLFRNRKSSRVLLAFTLFFTSVCLALSGVYGSLISYSNINRITDGILRDKDDYVSIENNYHADSGSYSSGYRNFSEEKAAAFEKELGYPLLKVVIDTSDQVQFDGTIVFGSKPKTGVTDIHTYYDIQYYNDGIRLCSIDSRNRLPTGYSILSGRLPSDDNEIRITDFQFEGIKDIRSRKDVSYTELTYQSILGKNLSLIWGKEYVHKNLSIVGVLDTCYDSKNFNQYKNYCLEQVIQSEQELSKEAHKLKSRKQSSYINLFFVTPSTLNSLKSTTYGKRGSHLTLDGRFLQDGSNGSTYINYLADQNKDKVIFFKDESFEKENFITRCLSVYLWTLDQTEERKSTRSITVPKKFLGKNAVSDSVYTESAYEFFTHFLDIPIHAYAAEHYKEAYQNSDFDSDYYTKYYYSSLHQVVPSVIPENDRLAIYEAYLSDYVASGKPDYSSPRTFEAFTTISESATELLSYYRDLYSDSIFKKRNMAFEKYNSITEQKEEIPFTIVGFTLPRWSANYYNPIRKKETLLELFPDSCAVYDSVRTASESSSRKIRQIAKFSEKDYSEGFNVRLTNPGASIENRKERKDTVSGPVLYLAVFFLVVSLVLQFVLFRKMLFLLSIDAQYQKVRGTPDKEIRKEAILPLLVVSLSSFLISIVVSYIILAIIKASLASYPLFGLIYPGYIEFLTILALSLVRTILAASPSLRSLKSKVHSITS